MSCVQCLPAGWVEEGAYGESDGKLLQAILDVRAARGPFCGGKGCWAGNRFYLTLRVRVVRPFHRFKKAIYQQLAASHNTANDTEVSDGVEKNPFSHRHKNADTCWSLTISPNRLFTCHSTGWGRIRSIYHRHKHSDACWSRTEPAFWTDPHLATYCCESQRIPSLA